MRVFLFGYYGFRNLGDDLMLLGLVQRLANQPEVTQIAIFVREDYYDFASSKVRVYSCNAKGWRGMVSRLRAYFCMLSSHLVLWGGGTCLYESEETGVAGLKRLARNVSLARLFQVPYVFIGVGIGSIKSQLGRAFLRRILEKSSLLFFRDRYSLDRALQNSPSARVKEGGDLVFLMRPPKKASPVQACVIKNIGFCGTYYHSDSEELVACYVASLSQLISLFSAVVHFIPFHGGERSDNLFHCKIAALLPEQSVVLHDYTDPAKTLSLMSSLDFVIGFRLHAVICADLLGVANLAVEYSPKVRYYVDKSGVLAKVRLIQIGQGIEPSLVSRLARDYQRSQKARDCFLNQERAAAEQSVTTLLKTYIENR